MAMSTSTAPWVPGPRSASGAESTTKAVRGVATGGMANYGTVFRRVPALGPIWDS
jgi:hypothetical protein